MAPVAITPGYTHSVAPSKPTNNATSIDKIDYAGLEAVANQLVQPGKGIYASDETPEVSYRSLSYSGHTLFFWSRC